MGFNAHLCLFGPLGGGDPLVTMRGEGQCKCRPAKKMTEFRWQMSCGPRTAIIERCQEFGPLFRIMSKQLVEGFAGSGGIWSVDVPAMYDPETYRPIIAKLPGLPLFPA